MDVRLFRHHVARLTPEIKGRAGSNRVPGRLPIIRHSNSVMEHVNAERVEYVAPGRLEVLPPIIGTHVPTHGHHRRRVSQLAAVEVAFEHSVPTPSCALTPYPPRMDATTYFGKIYIIEWLDLEPCRRSCKTA
jgi:hypothetical protein